MSGAPLWLGLDAGTSVVKAVLFDDALRSVARAAARTGSHAPRPLWSEVDLDTVWTRAGTVIREVLTGRDAASVAGIGVTGCMVGACVVDAAHRPLRAGILHNDGRATALMERLVAADPALPEAIFASSGIALQQGCTLPLLRWLDETEPSVLDRATAVLGMKDWLRVKLTGEIAGDPTEASVAPGDARSRGRSAAMIERFGIAHRAELLPAIRLSESVAGHVTAEAAAATGLVAGTPVATGAGDVPSSALGAGAVEAGDAVSVLGTTCLNGLVTESPSFEPTGLGLLFCVPGGAWLRVMVNIAGTANIDWALQRFLAHLPEDRRIPAMMEMAAAAPIGSNGVTWLPYLSGQGIVAPFVDAHARGALTGLEEAHGTGDILRAIHEGVAFAIRDCFDALDRPVEAVRLAGGGGRSPFWAQMIADVLERPVIVPEGEEQGARGAALLAMVATGRFATVSDAARALAPAITRRHEPTHVAAYDDALHRYRDIRDRLRGHGRIG